MQVTAVLLLSLLIYPMKGLTSKKTTAEVAAPKRNYPWFQIILAVTMTAPFITAIPNEDAEEKKVQCDSL